MNVSAAKSCYARVEYEVSSAVLIGTKQQPLAGGYRAADCVGHRCARVIIEALTQQIRRMETVVRQELKDHRRTGAYKPSMSMAGPILACTIGLEVGDSHRFARVGRFASYCRCVQSCALSNGKKKGEGNRKNGNTCL